MNCDVLLRYAAAELDCSQSLSLDPGYVKALQRRGTARAALGKYQEAKDDFLQVLQKEPKNKQAKEELDKVERVRNSQCPKWLDCFHCNYWYCLSFPISSH